MTVLHDGEPQGPTKEDLAKGLADELLSSLVFDLAIEEYHYAWRRRFRLNATAMTTASSTNGDSSAASTSSLSGQPAATNGAHLSATTMTKSWSRASSPGAPSLSPVKKEDVYYDCQICGRSVAASRYSNHLSGCMGIGSRRRTAGLAGTNYKKLANGNGTPSHSEDEGGPRPGGMNGLSNNFTLKNRQNTLVKRPATNGVNGSKMKKAKSGTPPANALLSSHPLSKTPSANSIPFNSNFRAAPLGSPARPGVLSSAAHSQAQAAAAAARPPPSVDRGSDRPDSDSEDSDDEPYVAARLNGKPPPPPGGVAVPLAANGVPGAPAGAVPGQQKIAKKGVPANAASRRTHPLANGGIVQSDESGTDRSDVNDSEGDDSD